MMLRKTRKEPRILRSSGLCAGVYVETFLDRRHESAALSIKTGAHHSNVCSEDTYTKIEGQSTFDMARMCRADTFSRWTRLGAEKTLVPPDRYTISCVDPPAQRVQQIRVVAIINHLCLPFCITYFGYYFALHKIKKSWRHYPTNCSRDFQGERDHSVITAP